MKEEKIKRYIYLWAGTLLIMSFAQVACFYYEMCAMMCEWVKHASFVVSVMFLLQCCSKGYRNSLITQNDEKGVSKSIMNYLYIVCAFIIWIRVLWAFSCDSNYLATISVVCSLIVNVYFTILLVIGKFNLD